MSKPVHSSRILRWYPSSWRERYGHELTALFEDTFGEGPIPWRIRAATAKAGLVQHLRASGLGGDHERPADHARSGSLLILCGWAFFVVGGAMLAKFNERWSDAAPRHERWLPTAGFVAIEVAAALGALIVLTAGLIALPALLNALRQSGWAFVRRQVGRVAGIGLVTLAIGIPVVTWAHHLSSQQRNGGLDLYTACFFVVGLLAVATLATTTLSVVSLAARLDLSTNAVVWLARLALAMVTVMALVAAGTAVWWISLAVHAPSVLGGRVPLDLVVIGVLMAAGLVLGATGSTRVTSALPDLRNR
jgi:hypothetical protein